MIRNIVIIAGLILAVAHSQVSLAQNRLISQVKQDVNKTTLTVDNFKDAINKIEPALSHEETKDDAEAWFIAGELNFKLYDQAVKSKSVGKNIDETLMYTSLIKGYDKMRQAMKLDSVIVRDKKGNPKHEKDGRIKVKTKYSKRIAEIIGDHVDAYRLAGSVLYVKQKNYQSAYDAWEIYTNLPYAEYIEPKKRAIEDTIVGKYCYMKGVAANMMKDNTKALNSFLRAIDLGYAPKEVFDFAINCAENEGDEAQLVELVKNAYINYGKDDPKYITFLINYCISKGIYEDATKVIDMAIAEYPNNAEYYDLKGVLIESQTGDIANSYEYYKKCLEIDPNHIKGNYDMGRYYYNVALKTEKDITASTKEIAEKYDTARPYLEKAYEADPNNTAARDALKNIYYRIGDAEKLEHLEGK